MAPVSYVKKSTSTLVQLHEGNSRGRAVGVRTERKFLIMSTNRKDQQRLIGMCENLAQKEIDQITYSISRGLESMDDRISITKSSLKQLIHDSRNKQKQIEED